MRRSRLYFIGAVIEAARYFVFVRLASELLGIEPGASRGLLHVVAPQLLVACGLAALSHDPVRYDPLRPFLAVAKALSTATALIMMPGVASLPAVSPGGLGPAALLAGFGTIAAWDLAVGSFLAFARPSSAAPDGRPGTAPKAMEDFETVAMDDAGTGGGSD